jgi:hypothetical protein
MPTDVLNKPGKLTDEEFKPSSRNHPEEGHKLLLAAPGCRKSRSTSACTTTRRPTAAATRKRLKDAEISLYAKMGAVCDVYDAITSNRPYKAGWDPAESLRKMAEWARATSTTRFPGLRQERGIYPIGSLVKLNRVAWGSSSNSPRKLAALADWGRKEIRIAETEMPGLMAIREEFAASQPLRARASPARCT